MTSISLTPRISAQAAWQDEGHMVVHGAPEGADALAIARAARSRGGLVVHVARDAARASATAAAIRFFASDIPVLSFPAWDCLPYDRISPSAEVAASRMAALSVLAQRDESLPMILITSINGLSQRVAPKNLIKEACFSAKPGSEVNLDQLIAYLVANGYARSSTVREAGEFAVRGGLVDIFPPGVEEPLRLDFFGDTLENIRAFDAASQRTIATRPEISLNAASEILLTEETIGQFRKSFRTRFGASVDSPVYEAVSAGRKHAGMEHWLPLFYESTDTLFDFIQNALIFMDHLSVDAAHERFEQISDYYEARAEDTKVTGQGLQSTAYFPLKPNELYLPDEELTQALASFSVRQLSPFAPPEVVRAFDFGARQGRSFAAERSAGNVNVFNTVSAHVQNLQDKNKQVIIAGWSDGSAERMAGVLNDHGTGTVEVIKKWRDRKKLPLQAIGIATLGLESGFEADDFVIIAEQDILGDRLVRKGKRKRAENFLTETASLSTGDLVVHVDHGIARYEGLKTLEINGAPHDCLFLSYAGGDKLFLPVENIELLSRFGSDDPSAHLDRLGGASWQSRKAKMRDRIRMMASELIKIAAAREMKKAQSMVPPQGAYDEFCARFPYVETEDQLTCIEDVVEDLAKGRPMDRLVCGDVGFGKTEVALRAAFIAALAGRQVAVIAPTTLLVRQHYRNFVERFNGFPVRVRQISRMVGTKEAAAVRAGLADGQVDIVIGTHALLAKSIKFRDVGLIIVDEEQHFGVKHKERLKEFRADTHVLTLTATPIPRTLQLAMTGIRDLSLIATPPVDRLAVRTSIGPFDRVIARETLLREHYRGGQSFFVAPRISDLSTISEFLTEHVPEVKFRVANGQMAVGELDDTMNAFYDGKFDVLVATTIIESGIDIPSANTLIVHRADMFGLSQLYQIRGRIGRSKARAYAYLTTSSRKRMTDGAERRLKVLQSLDTLGAGFTLASHDLDIRGAGNLLGEEQSGNVKEVGVELYQHMLEEAVASMREGGSHVEETWSPQINIGTSVLIPDSYVQDLDLRMSLYRRLSGLSEQTEIEAFGAELIDRFGPLPGEVDHLLEIVVIKALCHRVGVAKIDAGPKGAVVSFRNDTFANPAGLVGYIAASPYDVKLRPDQKLVFRQVWQDSKARLKGCKRVLNLLLDIAEDKTQ